jgi:hypothetical protein
MQQPQDSETKERSAPASAGTQLHLNPRYISTILGLLNILLIVNDLVHFSV